MPVLWDRPQIHMWSSPLTKGKKCAYSVPTHSLGWGRLDAGGVFRLWVDSQQEAPTQYKQGDLVRLVAKSNIVLSQDGKPRTVPPKTVVRVKEVSGNRPGRCRIATEIVGCSDLDLLGSSCTLMSSQITALEKPELFFTRGEEVEITAEISFRKNPLKGKRAKVVIPTDPEGDVGLEFPEDIRAGSLDGLGKSGYCLYVRAEALKASE
ncbi:MAG: hypothetical protein GF334_06365 [Candidatus Altiarchaeales archaeon]|nr:hypothetical protein [Candidatus Altiarchaeales archaeon]